MANEIVPQQAEIIFSKLDLSNMAHSEIDREIQKGLDDFDAGRVYSAKEIRAKMKKYFD